MKLGSVKLGLVLCAFMAIAFTICGTPVAAQNDGGYTDIAGEATSIKTERKQNNETLFISFLVFAALMGFVAAAHQIRSRRSK